MLLLTLRATIAAHQAPPAAFERVVRRHLHRAKSRFAERGAAICAMAAAADAGSSAGDGEAASGGGSSESNGAGSAIHLGRWLSHAPSAGFLIVLNRLLQTIEQTL